MKYYLGIDNGVSGSICLMQENGEVEFFIQTPVFYEQSYTRKKQNIGRIDRKILKEYLKPYCTEENTIFCVLERPLVNPGSRFFKTTMSAMRALEATLCIIEDFELPHMYCDSKNWQKDLLPSGIKGSPELKKASKDIATRLFPKYKELIKKQKDGDGLLIAEWSRRKQF